MNKLGYKFLMFDFARSSYQLVVEWESRYRIRYILPELGLHSYPDELELCHRFPLEGRFYSHQLCCNRFQQEDL